MREVKDSIFEIGVSGIKTQIEVYKNLIKMLAGHVENPVYIQREYDDGVPIICGIHPENGKFFVGDAGVFAGKEPFYTDEDIQKSYPTDTTNYKVFSTALRYLVDLDIRGVLKGSVLFLKDSVQTQNILGTDYVTFQPANKIYAVPANTSLAKKILAAKMGIMFSMSYKGEHLYAMEASPNVDVYNLTKTGNVWFGDASYMDVSGTANFTRAETDKAEGLLNQIQMLFLAMSPRMLNMLATTETYKKYVRDYNATVLSAADAMIQASGLVKYVESDFNDLLVVTKHTNTRLKRIKEKTITVNFFAHNKADFIRLYQMNYYVAQLNGMIASKLSDAADFKLLNTTDGWNYVAIDSIGNIVKLVDKL